MNSSSKKGMGLIKMVILGAIILVIISYLGYDIKNVIESEQSKKNFSYVSTISTHLWTKYLQKPAVYIWNDVWVDLIWHPAIKNLENLRDGKGMTIQNDGPKLPN